jgi:hypothetical protein
VVIGIEQGGEEGEVWVLWGRKMAFEHNFSFQSQSQLVTLESSSNSNTHLPLSKPITHWPEVQV